MVLKVRDNFEVVEVHFRRVRAGIDPNFDLVCVPAYGTPGRRGCCHGDRSRTQQGLVAAYRSIHAAPGILE